ncbi:MAG: Rieske 2Fe-2S domain-containing protein [Firmicutes bacterium]|nr:Rieske 2Fe-2S domain-containing protein [Alicyclobacillaceae bacterium]MCL6497114.1 Rieske 2Fe-2S domain-containing protein [Bacillota bacterium]
MLSQEDNALLTRVGPGTPMGTLMRQYWIPALLSSELPKPDCDPVRVMLLGEPLIAFRDSQGRVGLIQNHCPHRGASLFYGRNEEGGIRCVYHGWKFDVSGRCLDMPNEPPESDFKHKLRARAYPCVERGGVVWTYMGPRKDPPPLPDLEANQLPEGQYEVTAVMRECNWLQALEGDIDTSHAGFLHWGAIDPEEVEPDTFLRYAVENRAPRYAVVDTEYGAMYGAYRPAKPGYLYWRIAQFLFPFYTQPPEKVLGRRAGTRAWVPMDDTHTLYIGMFQTGIGHQSYRRHPLEGQYPPSYRMVRPEVLPNTTDWFGRFRMKDNAANDYGIDRAWQRTTSYTGIGGIFLEDQAVTESMGPIYDRSQEHLGTADVMIIRVRRRLLAAVRRLMQEGTVPPGVDQPEVYRVRSGGILLPEGADWIAATESLRQAYVEHPESTWARP